jgi:hypothetical protein
MIGNNTNKGFTIFFAVLVASLALAVGVAIYNVVVREIALSQIATQSQYAIFAADTAAECALYWDQKYTNAGTNNHGGSRSIFSTSSADTLQVATGSGIICNSLDITTLSPPALDYSQFTNPTWYGCPGTQGSAWCTTRSALAATTTFSITIANSGTPVQTYCATVVVAKKSNNAGEPSSTNITAHGDNTCTTSGMVRVERVLNVQY